MLGLLWMDDSDSPISRKISEAVRCYHVRFGREATICYANPVNVPELTAVDDVRVEPRANILPNHFLVGRVESNEVEAGSDK